MPTVGTTIQPSRSGLQYLLIHEAGEKSGLITVPQMPELWKQAVVQMDEYDPDMEKLLQYVITSLMYYVERTPIPMNQQQNISLDVRIDFLKKTRLPLTLTAATFSTLIVASIFGLPFPYGLIASIAFCGPLFVSLYGLKTQQN